MARTTTRYLKGTVDKVEYVIEFVIEELDNRELVARALRVDANKLRNVGLSSSAAYKKAASARRHRVERQVL